ncbi:hypothetical protein DFH11DRAFT_1812607 [Phellopilus nigrolimitatus]|nr:hypothetical protein DFH11DRAFT_1812607 [Phellopilus nigrolimitatus]
MDKSVFGEFNLPVETRHILRPKSHVILAVVLTNWSSNSLEIHAKDFLEKNPLLEHKVYEAWEAGSFKNIRRLKILQTRNVEEIEYVSSYMGPLPRAFYKSPYRGNAVEGFEEYLAHNELLFNKANRGGGDRYYAKSFSIVQSSGTGKSRLVHHLAEEGKCFLIYMNLGNSPLAYPTEDGIPVQLLCPNLQSYERLDQYCSVDQKYEAIYSAFFAAMFRCFASELTKLRNEHGNDSSRELARKWFERFSGPRAKGSRIDFFKRLQLEFSREIDAVWKQLRNYPKLSNTTSGPTQGVVTGSGVLVKACKTVETAIELSGEKLPLVIVFDEASRIAELEKDAGLIMNPAQILCKVISDYSHNCDLPIWSVFISTNSRIAGDFSGSPKVKTQDSDRIRIGGELLFRPFTELGFNQLSKPLKDIDMASVSRIDNLIGFGRPLWMAQYSHANLGIPQMVTLGQTKLARGNFQNTQAQLLAILAQRFCLDLAFGHPLTVDFEKEGVASHMRYLITTTENRDVLFATYPSEPFLSHCAAELLWSGDSAPENAIRILQSRLKRGMIDKGKTGELVTRLLLSLAKDICCTKLEEDAQYLRYCRSVGLISWLEALFGGHIFQEKVLRQRVDALFGNMEVNFSHWIGMDENIAKPDSTGGIVKPDIKPDVEWLQLLYVMTAAIQCHHGQPAIDQIIPMRDRVKNTMSVVLASTKNRVTAERHDLDSIDASNPYIGLDSDEPYIAILQDLGVDEESVVVSLDESGRRPCLRIHVKGCSSQVYPLLGDYYKELPGLLKVPVEPKSDGKLRRVRDQAKLFARMDNIRWWDS